MKQYNNNFNSFTLLELLIVISVIVLLATAALITLNPKKQIEKSQDTKRKQELTQLSKVLEDYYNDKGCYPPPSEICYNDTPGVTTCNICGNDPGSPDFNPYLSSLPCDPKHPNKMYLYQVDSEDCPTWFKTYTTLSNLSDPIISSVGCGGGCGPDPDFTYNYGVTSPNTGLEFDTSNLCSSYTSLYINPDCNICGSYEQCQNNYPEKTFYTDATTCIHSCIND